VGRLVWRQALSRTGLAFTYVELVFVRHGRPEHVETLDGTPADPELAAVGHEQARAVAQWLAEIGGDAVYSSPMRRARQTAAPIESALGLTATTRDGLSEFDRHATAYVPMEVLKASDPAAYRSMVGGDYLSDVEDPTQWFATVVDTVDGIVDLHPGQRVVVVCHGGVINAYLGHCLGFPPEDFLRFDVDYTSVTRIMASSQGHRSVASVNERSHFRGRADLAVRD